MKLESFTRKLLSVGFIQQTTDAENWFENHANGMSIFVGIMAHEVDCFGHIPIEVICLNDQDGEEIEKEYLTTAGAWKAINNLIK